MRSAGGSGRSWPRIGSSHPHGRPGSGAAGSAGPSRWCRRRSPGGPACPRAGSTTRSASRWSTTQSSIGAPTGRRPTSSRGSSTVTTCGVRAAPNPMHRSTAGSTSSCARWSRKAWKSWSGYHQRVTGLALDVLGPAAGCRGKARGPPPFGAISSGRPTTRRRGSARSTTHGRAPSTRGHRRSSATSSRDGPRSAEGAALWRGLVAAFDPLH